MASKQALKPSQLQNPLQLNKEHLEGVIKCLGRLAELDEDLAARTIRYVVDGTDDEVLLALGGQKQAAEALRLTGQPTSVTNWQQVRDAMQERAQLLRLSGQAAAAFGVRLAHVLEAVRRAAGNKPHTPPGWPDWLVVLVADLIQMGHVANLQRPNRSLFPVVQLQAILESAGLPTDLIAQVFLQKEEIQPLQGSLFFYYGNPAESFTGWNDYLSRHLQAVRAAFAVSDADKRLHVLRTLSQMQFDFTPIVDLLVEFGTGPAKTVREAAAPLLAPCADRAGPLIEKVLADGDAGQRHEAAQLLWRLFGRGVADVLRQHAAGETSERVRQTIERLIAAPEGSTESSSAELGSSLPPLQIELGTIPLPEEAKQGLREAFAASWKQHMQYYERALERWNALGRPKGSGKPAKPQPVAEDALARLFAFVEGKSADASQLDQSLYFYAYARGPFGEWWAPPGVKLIHVVRLAFGLRCLEIERQRLWWRDQRELELYRSQCSPPFGLRELDAAVATLPKAQPGATVRAYLGTNTKYQTFCDWEAEALWPAFAEYPEVLNEALGSAPSQVSRNYGWADERRTAFKVLALFPQLPSQFIPLLWDLALGEAKGDRVLAQAALASLPDKASRILVGLRDGRQGVRAAAAEWLGKIGDPAAIEPLKEAFRKEKQETPKAAIASALEACGADIQEFLDRDSLSKEAEAGLAKKRPKGLEWFPLDSLPALHWQDTGQAVDPKVVQWWLVQGVQQKSPVCSPLLRHYLALCRPQEAAALATFVLSAWIGHDTRTPPQEETAARASQEADKMWAQFNKQKTFSDFYNNDKSNLFRMLLQQYSSEFLGSAIDQKGLLAVAAAAGDGGCVRLCEGYIRKYYGNRAAQCKALVEVLAWVKHPQAIQVLLSLANRFRTKSIRQAAEEHVRALAEREGWTIEELADRTIPDAGFERTLDEKGEPVGSEATLTLDYGPRKFLVRLDDELQPVVTTEEGKTVKNPPAAAKTDDEEKAKAAKKAFTDAKKTVKDVVKRQAERLYEALCTQRTWRFEHWRRYLADHPIVGRLCVRLAWAAFADEHFLGIFRPLEDGSLTNEKDEEVTLPADAVVRLAHTCNTPAESAAVWVQHFQDYDVEPLFAQFGRATYTLPEAKKKETDITDFEGHVLTTFKLRSKATKLGYVRGDAEDGGWFYLYRKPFPSLGLQAAIHFTGSGLPEQDRPAALERLYFTALKGDNESASMWESSKLPLGKVPPVLLSECYNDVKQIAAEGSGFDPKWREKNYM
jgi:HEAT repeat protein